MLDLIYDVACNGNDTLHYTNLDEIVKIICQDKLLLLRLIEDTTRKNAKRNGYYYCYDCGGNDLTIFSPNNDTWFYKCFNCNLSGTAITYAMNYYNKSFIEAVKHLNDIYGLGLLFQENDKFTLLEKFLKSTSMHEKKYLRHHYYITEKGEIDSVKVIYKDSNTGSKSALWYIVDDYRATLASQKAREQGQRQKRKMLYNTDKIKDDTNLVCITEGEKDADNLCHLGYVAVSAMESATWLDEYTEQLKHVKTILIFGDNDPTGNRYVNTIIAEFSKLFKNPTSDHVLKIVYIPYKHEKEDISDYIERLKAKGLKREQIRREIEKLIAKSESILSPYETHCDKYGLYVWKEVEIDGLKDYKKQYLTDYRIKCVTEYHCIDDDTKTIYKVKIDDKLGNTHYRLFSDNDLNTVKQYKEAIRCIYCTTKTKDIDLIGRYVFSQCYPISKTVSYGGLRKINDEWVYIETEKCLISGAVTDDYIMDFYTPHIKTTILDYEPITQEEIQQLQKPLFNFNSPQIVYDLIGYLASIPLRAKLKEQGIKFPHALIVGEAGSGKTTTIETVAYPIVGASKTSNANGVTKYAFENKTASNTTTPVILDEYKPHYMASWRVDMISDFERNSYDGSQSERGTNNPKEKVKELQARTGLILVGEAGTDETAVLERSVIVSFSKRESYKYATQFEELKQLKPLLHKLSRSLLEKAIEADEAKLKETFNILKNEIEKRIKTPRIVNSLAICSLGIYLLKGVGFDVDMAKAVNILVENSIEEVGMQSKTELEQFMEMSNQAYPTIKRNNTDDYKLLRIEGNVLGVRLNELYNGTSKYIKDNGINDYRLPPKNAINKALRLSEYCLEASATGRMRFSRNYHTKDNLELKQMRCYRLDWKKLKDKLDVENFEKP